MVDARRPPVALVGGGRDRQPQRPERLVPAAQAEIQAFDTVYASRLYCMRHGVSSGSRRRRQGIRGPSCCGCSPAIPEIEVVHVTADSNAGAAVGELYPVACSRRTATCGSSPLDVGRPAPVSTSCSRALPHGASQALLARSSLDDVGHVDRPRRRLPAAARRVRSAGTASRTARPS